MNKIIKIILAVLAFLGAATTATWYAFDGDDATTSDITGVVNSGVDVYNAITADTATTEAAK